MRLKIQVIKGFGMKLMAGNNGGSILEIYMEMTVMCC